MHQILKLIQKYTLKDYAPVIAFFLLLLKSSNIELGWYLDGRLFKCVV